MTDGFFIRYNIPDPHLRVRFHGEGEFWNKVIQSLASELQLLVDSDIIVKVETDTYVREIERYGSKTMVDSEKLFFHDSVSVLKFLSLLDNGHNESFRIVFALKGIDQLLDDFGLGIESKKDLILSLRNIFFEEVKGDSDLTRQLDLDYRGRMKDINFFMTNSKSNEAVFGAIFDILTDRSLALKEVIRNIKIIIENDNERALVDLLCSYLHMFINRVFTSSQRKQELVLYHYLFKYYSSLGARIRRTVGSSNSNEQKIVQSL